MKKLILILFTLSIFNCVPYIDNLYDTDNETAFSYLCNQLKNHYVYTELKGLNIDELAEANPVSNSDSDEVTFEKFSDFINQLEDGHANIYTSFAYSSAYSIILDEYAEDYNPNFDWTLIKKNYLSDYSIYGYYLKNSIIVRDGFKFGYIYYNSFLNSFSDSDIEYILDRFEREGVSGVILDLRNNGGGSLLNAVRLIRYLGYDPLQRTKEAMKVWRRDGKSSYTKINSLNMTIGIDVPFTITRDDNAYKGKVALLTNRSSYSASSFTATSFKAYDNVRSFGDNSGGGMGLPIGGILPNGWKYRFSSNIGMPFNATGWDDNEHNYESGVPVDYKIDDDLTIDDGDEIIDAAISWIKGEIDTDKEFTSLEYQ